MSADLIQSLNTNNIEFTKIGNTIIIDGTRENEQFLVNRGLQVGSPNCYLWDNNHRQYFYIKYWGPY